MSRYIKAGELGAAMEKELSIYSEEVNEGLARVTSQRMEQLVRETKATAPTGRRNGQYRKNITADYKGLTRKGDRKKGQLRGRTIRATWYVKAPDYRLTHLLVHGHEKKNGGRTRSNPFLENAVNHVIPEYEKDVQEVLSK